MFRNTYLLRRSKHLTPDSSNGDARPLAIVADPYEIEAGLVVAILEKRGFRVLEARDGRVALQLTGQNRVSLIVASADMPQLSGTQLCQKIREISGPSIPFVLIGPEGAVPDKFAGFETFANDYAQRPLNLEELEARVDAVLRSQPEPPRLSVPFQPVKNPAPAAEPAARFISVRQVAASLEELEQLEWDVVPVESESIDQLLDPAELDKNSVRAGDAALYKEAFELVKLSFDALRKRERIAIQELVDVSRRMVRSIGENKSLLMLATDRTPAFSFQQHSMNVAIIAARVGQTLKMPEDRLVRICLAGLVHDVGSVKLSASVIGKNSAFSSLEREEMRRRPLYSEELLSGYEGFEWLPLFVGQVYERENGSGYPRGTVGREIRLEAKILGAADTFEACIHRRMQRAAMTGYQAIEIMTTESHRFSDTVVRAVLSALSVYPLNEFVLLNTGEIGRVTDINPDNPLRPIIRVLYSGEGEELISPRSIDLVQNSQLWIKSALTVDQLPQRTR
jgi:HD-GYP domain-containing protein (c-di-GMP phosphodiesterase class II)/CheY-like chemotaxis protein